MANPVPLADAKLLKGAGGEEFAAASLWADGPVLVVVLRRPGCLLCREEAIRIWAARDKFEAAGVRLVCVVHEWIPREIEAFAPEYWGGELYLDPSKSFYAAAHGGSVQKGAISQLLNPFSAAWKHMRRAKSSGLVKDSNMKGDGLTLGGLLVIKKGGEVSYRYAESTFGDHAPQEEVLAAAQAVGSK